VKVVFAPEAWASYLEWARTDQAVLLRIHALIESARRTPFEGLGKPEPLKSTLRGFWFRRITREHRLVYRVAGTGEDQRIEIASCRMHY
jgi:toxin YoeB